MRSHFFALSAILALALGLVGCNTLRGPRDPKQTSSSIAEINTKLGVAHMEEGNYEVAMKKLQSALENDSSYPEAHHAIAVLHEHLRQDAEAEQHYQRAIALVPDYSRALNDYGRFLCTHGKPGPAQGYFAKAQQNPLYDNREAAYTNSGICYLRSKDSSHAEQSFRAALQANPQYAPALLQMARIHHDRGEYLQARGYLQRYGEVGTPNPQSLWLGVRTERQLGNRDAEGTYAMLLKNKFPDSEETRLLLESQR